MNRFSMDSKTLILIIFIKIAMWSLVLFIPYEIFFSGLKPTFTEFIIWLILLIVSLLTKVEKGGKRIL